MIFFHPRHLSDISFIYGFLSLAISAAIAYYASRQPIDSRFGRVVLIGGADPRATQPENPTLAHLAR